MNTQVLCQEIRARQEPTPENGATLGRLINGESARRNELKHDGTPYAVKVASTVWSGGKFSDYLKELPITILEKELASSLATAIRFFNLITLSSILTLAELISSMYLS